VKKTPMATGLGCSLTKFSSRIVLGFLYKR
jgi:hypothetical protein